MLHSRSSGWAALRAATALCALSFAVSALPSFPTAAVATAAPNAALASAVRAAVPDLVAYDGQRLSGELYVGSLRVPAGVTVWADDGLRVTSSSSIEIEGTLRSVHAADADASKHADIVLVAAEQISVRDNGLVLGADGRVGRLGDAQAEMGASVLLVAPVNWIDGIVHAGAGGAIDAGQRGGDGGNVIVLGNAWTRHRESSLERGGFGGVGGYGGGNGGHALALGTSPHDVDLEHELGIVLDLGAWWSALGSSTARIDVPRVQRDGLRSFQPGDGDDEAPACPSGTEGATGAHMTGNAGGTGVTGPDAPPGSGANGGNGGDGGGGGSALGGTGGTGGTGANCCPNAGGTGGPGGPGGNGTGGRGGSGGPGGNGDGAGLGGCGGSGNKGGDGKAGRGGTGGPGGPAFGGGGGGGSPGIGTGGAKGAKGPNGGPLNPACAGTNGTPGNGYTNFGGMMGAWAGGC